MIRQKENGFSLVELIIAMAIALLMLYAINAVYMNASKILRNNINKLKDREIAAMATKRMEKEIRETENSSGFEAISRADVNDIIFYSDCNNDGVPEKIEYYLQGSKLYRKITESDTQVPPYSYNGTAKTTVLAQNVISSGIFGYQSGYDNELTSLPLNGPDRQSVKVVRINLSVDSTPGTEPPAINIELDVYLRNRK